jgi:thiol-disulfide isomerase/thioredoxin
MRLAILAPLVICAASLLAQTAVSGPTDAKAQKTYQQGIEYLKQRMIPEALGSFKKADKQDGGRCIACQKKMLQYALQLQDWDTAETAASELVTEVQNKQEVARARYDLGVVYMRKGLQKPKDEHFRRVHEEMTKALEASANFPAAVLLDGRALAYLKQDEIAKQQFQRFVTMLPASSVDRERVLRYIARPELARARMAPPFAVTTLDGQRISLDALSGKVVLLDFWATWCGPCRRALPEIQSIAKKFAGQPLVILSVSLDNDEQKWKQFVAENKMTWLQYCDKGFGGPISKSFSVQAIPHTFTIDADGVLQDEQIGGDSSIEGKLKKLVNNARKLQAN